MKFKKILSSALLIIGIALIVYSVHSMYQISQAKMKIHNYTMPFSKKPVEVIIGESPEEAAGHNDEQAMWYLVGGIVLAVVGGWSIIRCKKREGKN